MIRKHPIAALAVAGLLVATSALAAGDAAKSDAAKSKAVASATKKMDDAAKDVDKVAAAKGDEEVAERLAKLLNTTPDALIAERKQLDCSGGALANAHILAARAGGSTTVAQLVQEHKDGQGWGEIAKGLNLKMGQVVSDARQDSRAAAGEGKGGTNGKSAGRPSAGNASRPTSAMGGGHGHGH